MCVCVCVCVCVLGCIKCPIFETLQSIHLCPV